MPGTKPWARTASVTATSVIHDWISADPPAHATSQTDIFPRSVYIDRHFGCIGRAFWDFSANLSSSF